MNFVVVVSDYATSNDLQLMAFNYGYRWRSSGEKVSHKELNL